MSLKIYKKIAFVIVFSMISVSIAKSAEECFEKTSEVIQKCFEELILHKIDLKGIILIPNMKHSLKTQ